jgi:hypothetical protein
MDNGILVLKDMAKSDFARALPSPSDPAMAQLAHDEARHRRLPPVRRGEAVTARRGRFDDFTPAQ